MQIVFNKITGKYYHTSLCLKNLFICKINLKCTFKKYMLQKQTFTDTCNIQFQHWTIYI